MKLKVGQYIRILEDEGYYEAEEHQREHGCLRIKSIEICGNPAYCSKGCSKIRVIFENVVRDTTGGGDIEWCNVDICCEILGDLPIAPPKPFKLK